MAVPSISAQEVCTILVESGIKGIMNFSPVLLQAPDDVIVNNINLCDELEIVIYTLFSSRCRDLYVRRLLRERLCLNVLACGVFGVTWKDTEVCRVVCRDGRI